MKKLLLFLFALVTMATHAQTPGDIAQSYSGNSENNFNSSVEITKQQADGKFLVGGNFTSYNGVSANKIIRLNSNGTIDTTFNTGTGFNDSVSSVALQADGKMLIVGDFTSYNGVTENRIIRLNSDGSKDVTFNTGTGFNNYVAAIAIQADGKILVVGFFTSYNGITENRIIRLNSDGSKDTTFTTGIGFSYLVSAIKLQVDGKILVGGLFSAYKGVTSNRIIRLNSNGSKDTSFDIGTGFDSIVRVIELQTDGKILVGGDFTTYKGVTENSMIRLNSNGSKDTSFTTGTGFNFNSGLFSVSVIEPQNDGKLIVAGDFNSYNGSTENSMIRLNSNGSKDATFVTATEFTGFINTIAPQVDGKILVGGAFARYNGSTENHIIRLNTDGTKDDTFNNGQFDNIIRTTEEQTDGKILVGGLFTSFKGSTENRIIRLNTDSTKDTSFNTGTGFDGTIYSIKKQTDGKIIVGGGFTTYNGVAQNYLIRLNADGTKDTGFDIGAGFDGSVRTVKILNNGKILVGGTFTNYQGVTANRLILLNADGTKDTSFNTGTGFNNDVYTLAQQTDGKFLVGGFFTTYKGVTTNRIVRLNTDGSLDTTFITGTAFSSTVLTIELQTDGKILVGGFFVLYNGLTANKIIRLNTDGTINNSFATGTGFNTGTGIAVRAIEIQVDGKIVVGGSFSSYNGVTENRIITLKADGTKDTAFIAGTGFDDEVYTINQLADEKILVGGNFSTYKGNSASAFLIKLETKAPTLSTPHLDTTNDLVISPNPVQDILHLQTNAATIIKTVQIIDLQGKVIVEDKNESVDVSKLSKGVYIVKIETEKGEVTKKFIKE